MTTIANFVVYGTPCLIVGLAAGVFLRRAECALDQRGARPGRHAQSPTRMAGLRPGTPPGVAWLLSLGVLHGSDITGLTTQSGHPHYPCPTGSRTPVLTLSPAAAAAMRRYVRGGAHKAGR